jgi:hypothetical protein
MQPAAPTKTINPDRDPFHPSRLSPPLSNYLAIYHHYNYYNCNYYYYHCCCCYGVRLVLVLANGSATFQMPVEVMDGIMAGE